MEEIRWYEKLNYTETKDIIKEKLQNMSRDFVAIGFYLKLIRDKSLFLEDGYKSIWEFAEDNYGIKRSTASRWMAMNDRFSKNGNTPILSEEYISFKKRLYKGLNLDDNNKDLYKEYSPEMRDEAFRRGLEEYKREIEFNVGLAYGDLSDAQEVDKTATEVLASKTRKYNRVTAIQGKLEECLKGFVNALAFYNGSYTSGVEFTCEFNDSILADEESERQQDRQDVSMGVMSLVEYRMKWYNEDEATAKSKIPEQNRVME